MFEYVTNIKSHSQLTADHVDFNQYNSVVDKCGPMSLFFKITYFVFRRKKFITT